MIKVDLTYREFLSGAMNGILRKGERLERDQRHRMGAFPLDAIYKEWATEMEGALAEIAAAKALKIYWNGAGGTAEPDLGIAGEVRHTLHPHGKLVLRADERNKTCPYWLVTGALGCYTLVGWAWAKDMQQEAYWGALRDGNDPVWAMPQEDLNSPHNIQWYPQLTGK